MTQIKEEPNCFSNYSGSSLCCLCNWSMSCELFEKYVDDSTKDIS